MVESRRISCLQRALQRMSSLRMQAVRATLGRLPTNGRRQSIGEA